MFNHQTAILNDLYSSLGQFFSDSVMANSGLHPDGFWFLSEYVVQMARHILWSPEHVNHIHIVRHVYQFPIHLLAQYLCYLRIVNGHWDDFEAGGCEVTWNVESRLI